MAPSTTADSGYKAGNWRNVAPAAVLVAGLTYSAWLVSRAEPAVFFSGDGGLKYLLTQQIAGGQSGVALRLEAPDWIRALWADGLFPFQEPFVYVVGDQRVLQYPPFFSYASAPIVRALGSMGQFFLPLGALWATWIAVLLACRRLGCSPEVSAATLFLLVFCTPLTLYGAMYWEHTLGVALAISGVTLAFLGPDRPTWAAIGGILVGLAAWARSELLLFAVVMIGLATRPRTSRWSGRRAGAPFVVGVVAIVGILLVLNYHLFGRPLGMHGRALGTETTLGEWFSGVAQAAWRLWVLLLEHAPFVVPVTGLALVSWQQLRQDEYRVTRMLLLASGIFVVALPFALPSARLSGYGGKQWGPRFLLPVVPLMCVAGATMARQLWEMRSVTWRAVLALGFAAATGFGLYLNTVVGSAFLMADYEGRVLPALRIVQGHPVRTVVVANQFIAQELVAAMDRSAFVLARDGRELGVVARAALEAGSGEFLFISDAPVVVEGARAIAPGRMPAYVSLRPKGTFGAYVVHEAVIVPMGQ